MHTSDKMRFVQERVIYELHVGSEPYFLTLSPHARLLVLAGTERGARYELCGECRSPGQDSASGK